MRIWPTTNRAGQIYVTRAPAHGPIDLLSPSTQEKMNAPFALPGTMAGGFKPEYQLKWSCGSGSRINIAQGRPDMLRCLEDLLDSSLDFNATTGAHPRGCAVAVCGPSGLVGETRRATTDLDADRRLRVNGIELMRERFE